MQEADIILPSVNEKRLGPQMSEPGAPVANLTEAVKEESVAHFLESHEDLPIDSEKSGPKNEHLENHDPEGEEEDEEDEDMSSEISEGVDLQDDLQDALEDENFSFKGSFYHSAIQTTAPNPCLYISGLGLVGLPLSERDAKSIISVSNLAPFGRGERTLVDKEVRDTWEIEPSRISFANPQWENYINQTICTEVCRSLGVTIGNTPPKMELYKLLLYEKGSHFLAHQDTQKANGMFATVIILLPSAYTGGQVIVSHSTTTKTIDFSANSLLSTALLAWYTDVKHEVKPVTSGYRLALSYNLIQVSPTGIPSLPDMVDSTSQLRRVLTKWREDKYDDGQNMMTYLLNHQYSTANLKVGIKALKGADLHRVTFLRPIAEELGFVVGLASLEHNVTGPADDYGGGSFYGRGRWGHRRYDYYDDEGDYGETPGMAEVDSTSTNISGLVDLEGGSLVSLGKIEIEDNCLIPKDPFEDQSPDDEEYEGYMGNWAGQVEHWYRRTVLVLVHQNNVDDLCYSVEGAPYAMRKLKESSNPPTSEDRYWAIKAFQSRTPLTRDHLLTLIDYSFKWKDVGIWKKVMSSPMITLRTVEMELLLKGWETFSFEGVRVGFEEILARSTVLSEKMTFLSDIRKKSPDQEKEAVTIWHKKESDKVLASYSTSNVQDSGSILIFMKFAGLESFKKVMMPNLLKIANNYSLLLSLIKIFEDNRKTIIEQETQVRALESVVTNSEVSTSDSTALPLQKDAAALPDIGETVSDLAKQCLQAAALQWSSVQSYPSYSSYPYNHHRAPNNSSTGKVDRIITILDNAISLSEMNICRTIIIDVLKSTGSTKDKFAQIYNPLIPRLRILLANKKLDIATAPFVDFLQIIIGLYMRDILGKRGNLLNPKLRKIGCGCNDCKDLDKFILDPSSTTSTFRVVQARRLHLERQCASARDLCTYQTIKSGSPHAVQVTKLPEIIQASTWAYRQKSAKAFLSTIGDDAVIAKIMGPRYLDVINAISGAIPFGAEAPRTHVPVPTTAASTSSTTGPPTTTVPQVADIGFPVRTSIQPTPVPSGVLQRTSVPPQAVSASNPIISQHASLHPQASSSSHSSSNIGPAGTSSAAPPQQVAGKKRKSGPTKTYIQLGPVIDLTSDDE